MFEFDISATVTSATNGILVPVKVAKTVPAKSRLDSLTLFKKGLFKNNQTLHVLLDVQCFKRNIRKERVSVSDDELHELEKGVGMYHRLNKTPYKFKQVGEWDF